jgi:hypothetical protein
MEKIKVTVKKDGTIEYQVTGVKGRSCKEVSKFIDSLGKVTESKTTSEYSQTEDEHDRQRTR